jgi:hypothetical protein
VSLSESSVMPASQSQSPGRVRRLSREATPRASGKGTAQRSPQSTLHRNPHSSDDRPARALENPRSASASRPSRNSARPEPQHHRRRCNRRKARRGNVSRDRDNLAPLTAVMRRPLARPPSPACSKKGQGWFGGVHRRFRAVVIVAGRSALWIFFAGCCAMSARTSWLRRSQAGVWPVQIPMADGPISSTRSPSRG